MKLMVRAKKDMGIQSAPLVDVVFQLLIFFLLASSFNLDRELPTPLPGAATKEISDKIPVQIEIEIKPDNRIFVKKKEYDSSASTELLQLREMLKEYAKYFTDPMVILMPADKIAYQRVINVLDACFAAKITKVSFSAAPSQTDQQEFQNEFLEGSIEEIGIE